MATEIDELIVQISADTRQLRTELDRVRRQTDNAFPTGSNSPVNRFGAAIRGLVGPLLAVGGAMAAVGAVKGIATVADEFEALNITLDRIYDGKGQQAFTDIQRFAQTTPFQLEDTTKAFIALKSNGIEPSTEMLTIFGDAASAAMNPLEAFNALIRITQRAAGGGLGLEELEQLVNQGLPVYTILQDQLGVTRMEISELGKSAEGAAIIMRSLNRGLEEGFGGIMEQRMELLSTKISNAQIAMKSLGDEISKHGLQSFLKDIADHFTSIATNITRILAASRTGVSTEMQALLAADERDPDAIAAQARADRQATAQKSIRDLLMAANLSAGAGLQDAMPDEFNRRLREIVDGTAIATIDLRDELTQLIGTATALTEESMNSLTDEFKNNLSAEELAALQSETFAMNLMRGLRAERDAIEKVIKDGNRGEGPLMSIGAPQRADALQILGGRQEQLNAAIEAIDAQIDQGGEFQITLDVAGNVTAARKTGAELAEEAQKAADEAAQSEADKAAAREGLRLSAQVGVAQKALEKLINPVDTFQQILDDLDSEAFTKAFKPEQIAQLRAHFEGLIADENLDQFTEKYDDLIKAIERTKNPADELQTTLNELTAVARGDNTDLINKLFGTTDPEAIAEILRKVGEEVEELRQKSDEAAETFGETMAPAIASLAHSFTNDFVSALTSGQDALRAFNDFAKNIVNQIIATFLQMAVVNQIINGIFAGVGGFKPLPTIDVFGGSGRASGGAVSRMKPYLVGERGPELFVPAVAGTIKNAADTRSMSSGGAPIVVNQNLNFSTGVVPTVRAEVAKMLPQISDATKTSVLEATRRGGNYRRGLLGG